MGKTKSFEFKDADDYVSAYAVTKEVQKKIDTISALLNIDAPVSFAIHLTEQVAKDHAKGKTSVQCLNPALGDLITDNPEFFQALCEEGVFDWVAPFVMRKTAEQS